MEKLKESVYFPLIVLVVGVLLDCFGNFIMGVAAFAAYGYAIYLTVCLFMANPDLGRKFAIIEAAAFLLINFVARGFIGTLIHTLGLLIVAAAVIYFGLEAMKPALPDVLYRVGGRAFASDISQGIYDKIQSEGRNDFTYVNRYNQADVLHHVVYMSKDRAVMNNSDGTQVQGYYYNTNQGIFFGE